MMLEFMVLQMLLRFFSRKSIGNRDPGILPGFCSLHSAWPFRWRFSFVLASSLSVTLLLEPSCLTRTAIPACVERGSGGTVVCVWDLNLRSGDVGCDGNFYRIGMLDILVSKVRIYLIVVL